MLFNKKSFTLLSAALLGVFTIAMVKMQATAWDIDKSHSSVNFEVRHFFTPVSGSFEDYTSEVYFDPENLAQSSISVTIPVNSINTKNERRDGHLLSADFFEAEKYPNITFTSERIKSLGNNKFVAEGTLTIKDVTKDFDLNFTLLGVQENAFNSERLIAGISAETSLLRNDYNVGTGDWVSDAVVGNEVEIEINLELGTDKNKTVGK